MSKKIILASIFVFLAVLASSCGESAKLATTMPQPSNITLMGTVYELVWNGTAIAKGDPVAGAYVRLDGESGTWSTISNANGEYSFRGIPDGNYTIVVTSEGHLFIPLYSQQITIKPYDNVSADNTIMTWDIIANYRFVYITEYLPQPGAEIPVDQSFTVRFNAPMDTSTVKFRLIPRGIRIAAAEGDTVQVNQTWSLGNQMVTIEPEGNLISNEVYELRLDYSFPFGGSPPYHPLGAQGETFVSAEDAAPEFMEILNHFATYETNAGGVPAAPSNLQAVINGKTTSEVDFTDVITITNDINLYWEPSSSGNVTGYRVYVAQSDSLNNYALLMDVTPASWTTNNYFTSEIVKVLDAFHAMSGIDPIGTENYPFVNNTIYFKVVAFNGDGESGGGVVSAKDAVGPAVDLFAFSGRTGGGGFPGGVQNNNYYLPSLIDGTDTKVAYIGFGEPIDPNTVITANFTHSAGTVLSAEFMTSHTSHLTPFLVWSGNVLSIVKITSDTDFSNGDTITAGVGVKDLAGNSVLSGSETATVQ